MVFICISCIQPQKTVYFKETRVKIEESKHHLHRKEYSPHFIPYRHGEINSILVEEYDRMYRKKQLDPNKQNGGFQWLLGYLLLALIGNLNILI